MKNPQYARIGKVLPLNLYTDRSGMKDLVKGEKEQEVKQLESSIQY